MNLKEFANVDSFLRDIDTGQEIPYREYMRRIINKLGIENIKRYLPYNIDYLKEKLKEDIHLNNTPIHVWDSASGFTSVINRKTGTQTYDRHYWGISDLFVRNGITCFSVSEGVSVLKNAARMLCEGAE